MKYAALALAAAGAAHAQSSTGARFGLKGGKFDINGFAANGLDVFGFDKNGKDAWGRPISETSAGLVAPVGKANEPKQYKPAPSSAPAPHKPPKPVKPTPTPYHTPTYTTITGSKYPVVESTMVWPMSTLTQTVVSTASIPTYSYDVSPTGVRPVESAHIGCYGGITVFTVKGDCSANGNFLAEMYLSEVAWFTGTKLSDWDIISVEHDAAAGTTKITTVTCSKWAFDQLFVEQLFVVNPGAADATIFPTLEIKLCAPTPSQPYHSTVDKCTTQTPCIKCGKKAGHRGARAASCPAGQYVDHEGGCSKCLALPGCQSVTCSDHANSVCTSCHASLSVSSIGACN
eukprot:comp22101_c0_seq3/m.32255 comp22101_c0_seq3/g.32255  ORF comp22101_c0_seq3/g.32255 comp22101_c0_seq3/m.32255 type:complete len:344 (-) comp22101_c0_seq3:412-1443(-)